MASNLTIVCGSLRFNLNDKVSFFLQRGYYPSAVGKGRDDDKDTLTETVTVQLRGNAISPNIQSLNRLFWQARQNNPADDKVFIEYKVAENEDPWRSRIHDGKVELTDNVAQEWPRKRVNVEISFERDGFWEGPEQVLPIGNVNNGVVYNCNDMASVGAQKRTNMMLINANFIEGDLPTPCFLEMLNNNDYDLGSVWIGVNSTRPDYQGGWMMEAESAIGVTPVSDATASGGAYVKGTLSYGQALPILRFNLPFALVNQMRGQRVKFLMRPHFTGAYSVFKYKIVMKHGTIKMYETDWVRESELLGRHWLDMFDLQIPPWLEGEIDLEPVVLELHATPTDAGTWQWAFDDFMFFPMDSFVELMTSVPPEGMVIVDGEKGYAMMDGFTKYGLRKMVGNLMLKPRAMHVFLFAMHATYINQAPIDMTLFVTGKYRPRRLTL